MADLNPFPNTDGPVARNQGGIDTTPTLPKPPAGLVEAATRDIPSIMADVKPQHDGATELIASQLATRGCEMPDIRWRRRIGPCMRRCGPVGCKLAKWRSSCRATVASAAAGEPFLFPREDRHPSTVSK